MSNRILVDRLKTNYLLPYTSRKMHEEHNKAFQYQMPTRIIFKENSIQDIELYIKGRKTLLVTSEGAVKRGLISKIKTYTPHIVATISGIQSYPEFNELKKIYNHIRNIEYELILAVGGGSVIDAVKFFSVQNSTRNYQFVENIVKGNSFAENFCLVPFISVPTTSGTSSEITPWATIWDKVELKKYSLHLPNLFGETAIYDPVLTWSVPKNVTIQTALDALSHALESIWNKNANPISVTFAIKAAKLIIEYIVPLTQNLSDASYRKQIMLASMYAGLAFSNTQTAIAHAMSYYLTTHKDVPHGIACSFTLPELIDRVIGKYEFIDSALEEIFGELSSTKLRTILHELNVSTEYKDYNISNDEINEIHKSIQNNVRAQNSLI